jgi:hypothetical protein
LGGKEKIHLMYIEEQGRRTDWGRTLGSEWFKLLCSPWSLPSAAQVLCSLDHSDLRICPSVLIHSTTFHFPGSPYLDDEFLSHWAMAPFKYFKWRHDFRRPVVWKGQTVFGNNMKGLELSWASLWSEFWQLPTFVWRKLQLLMRQK